MAYRVEVRSLFSSLSASRAVSGQLELSDVELGEQLYRFDGPVAFDVTLTNAGTGIVAEGTVEATVRTSCVRCLCDMCLRFDAPVDGFYVLPGKDVDLPEEQEFELVADDLSVDLEPVLAASLVVELPYAPVHDPDCKGICPLCGGDLNAHACDCAPDVAPSPFDVLKQLKEEKDDGA